MNLEIEYHEQAPLPPEVCAVANTQRGNLKRYLSGPHEVTHVASSEHQIAALESIIELGRIDKVTLAIIKSPSFDKQTIHKLGTCITAKFQTQRSWFWMD